jgi:hypothetical protein
MALERSSAAVFQTQEQQVTAALEALVCELGLNANEDTDDDGALAVSRGVARARAMLGSCMAITGNDIESAVTAMLIDLRHLCDSAHFDWGRLEAEASLAYCQESHALRASNQGIAPQAIAA